MAEVVLEIEGEVQEHRVEGTVQGKGGSQPAAEGGNTEQLQIEQRVLRSAFERDERNEKHSGEGEIDFHPRVAPSQLASTDQAINQTAQSGGQRYEPAPVRSTGVWRLVLIHPPPSHNKRGYTDWQVDQEDAPPADAGSDESAQYWSESGGHSSDRAPDSEGHPPLFAVEAMS